MPESRGCNQIVRGDDDGEEADDGEGGEEDGGAGGDCPLHQGAIGGRFGVKGYGGKSCKKERYQKRFLAVTMLPALSPLHRVATLLLFLLSGFYLLVETEEVAEDNEDDEGCWADDIISEESGAH